ncbi:MAG: hypothetical protein JWP57_1535 [Spirosoma sp.]|nr:hypothetical protein [Spirosoma sp.]
MPQNKIKPSAVQSDKTLFAEYCAEIDNLTAHAIAAKGLVSYTTIYEFRRGNPISQKKEDALVESVRLCKIDRATQQQEKLEVARQVLAA